MHFVTSVTVALSALLFHTPVHASANDPVPPGLKYLYTAFIDITPPIAVGYGPYGNRSTIPIVGGNFTGPRVSGKVLDVGGDWVIRDVQTGTFHADTRYNLQTNDGANIFVQTFGPSQPRGGFQLSIKFETGNRNYYWLNNLVAFGVLQNLGPRPNAPGNIARIDAFYLDTENANTLSFQHGA